MTPRNRAELCEALTLFIEEGGGTFRKLLEYMGMSYRDAYDEGWMNFTNALDKYGEDSHAKNCYPQV